MKDSEILQELALNLRWSWSHRADCIWQELDPELWELTRNPWVILQTVSQEKIDKTLANPEMRKNVENLVELNRKEMHATAWFQKKHAKSNLKCIAYFSMEYMLTEALPIYSGGLGNVAGDQLKAASDLGVPVVGIGLLYQRGYFRQIIDKEGAQQPLYPFNNPGQLPITPLRKANGEWLRLEVALPGWSVWLRAWQVQVGRVKLYLLDSNDAANYPAHRGITSELYGGDSELRLKQELVLGIGGWRLLEELGIKPDVCHLNEGHAAFAVLERAYDFMRETGHTFEIALETVRVGNLFTTHTAVSAGFDLFSPDLIRQYLTNYTQNKLGISIDQLLGLGRLNPQDTSEKFNMAYLAVRGSGAINGVSKLHEKVSKQIFAPLFPRWPQEEIPIGYVTNGVHVPTWDSKAADDLWTETCGEKRWLEETESLCPKVRNLSNEKIWKMRQESRKVLVEFARKRLSRILAARGLPAEDVERSKHLFDGNILTLGFARRFATYKRPNLLLHDPERLLRILSNPERPIQLIIAGKAHPADKPGQDLIQQWIRFIRKPEARPYVMFLSDYDMQLTEQLVQGVDVWINNPLRPWEACGTSGMKVLANGGLNVSELDGWWAEAYSPKVGWALGDGKEHGDNPAWNAVEASRLYDLIEHEIAPEFYERNAKGIPEQWVGKIRESMSTLTPYFSANRSVREYTEKYYIPAAEAYKKRVENGANSSSEIVNWHHVLEQRWSGIEFKDVTWTKTSTEYTFIVDVDLNDLESKDVSVEMYADGLNGPFEHHLMTFISISKQISRFQVKIPIHREANDYTARVIPCFPGALIPLEADLIAWQNR